MGALRIIGLLGGVASGKSFVAEEFRRLGAGVLDADQAGHEVLRLADVKDELLSRFGEDVLQSDGEVNRAALARLVFGNGPKERENLAFLERLTHPRIGELLESQAEELAAAGTAAAVLDAAVMLKAGWNVVCDCMVFVDAPASIRLERALARGWTEQEFQAREAAQESLETKRGFADEVIDNSRNSEYTRTQVEKIWRFFVSGSPPS